VRVRATFETLVDDDITGSRSRRGAWILGTLAIVGLLAVVVGIVYAVQSVELAGATGLGPELRDRGRIAVVGDRDLLRLEADGAQLLSSSEIPELDAVLDGRDEARLDAVLQRNGLAGLLVDGRGTQEGVSPGASLRERLRAYDHFEVLQGVHLAPVAALYVRRHGLTLSEGEGAILARAARVLLGGASIPQVRAFPEPLRRTRNVEVMVMIREGDRPRLWRSARGGSIARALITAAGKARERWIEREPAMRDSLDERLPYLTVEVFLLEEDGTLGERTEPFVERAFTDAHGVAFEARGGWHYLLPDATRERGAGSAGRAYRALFEDAGLPENSLEQRDLRLYRLVARAVGSSPPSATSTASPSPVPAPVPAPSAFDGELLDLPMLDGL
jgi:hypothetical protein